LYPAECFPFYRISVATRQASTRLSFPEGCLLTIVSEGIKTNAQ
jgi:hypothetical protein